MADLETSIQGRVLELICWRFSSADRIQDPRLRGYIYDPEASPNPLPVYSGGYAVEPASPCPAVYVYSQGLSTGSLNPLHGYTVEIDGDDRVSGSFTDLDSGNVMILCEGKTPAQAGALGWEIYNLLRQYSPVLAEEYELFHAAPVQYKNGEPLQGAEGQQQPVQNYASNIGYPWHRIRSWTVESGETSP